MAEKSESSKRLFETLFDGDEINGKFYPLGAGVTDLDAPTADYLVRAGRLAEVSDPAHFAKLKKAHGTEAPAEETPEEKAEREQREAADQRRTEATEWAHSEFAAGRVPTDLLDPDRADKPEVADRLKKGDELKTLATAGGVTIKSSDTKAEIAQAIMGHRRLAEVEAEANGASA